MLFMNVTKAKVYAILVFEEGRENLKPHARKGRLNRFYNSEKFQFARSVNRVAGVVACNSRLSK